MSWTISCDVCKRQIQQDIEPDTSLVVWTAKDDDEEEIQVTLRIRATVSVSKKEPKEVVPGKHVKFETVGHELCTECLIKAIVEATGAHL